MDTRNRGKSSHGSLGARVGEFFERNGSSDTASSPGLRLSTLNSVTHTCDEKANGPQEPESGANRRLKDGKVFHRSRPPRYHSTEDYPKAIKAHSRRSIRSCMYPGECYINFAGWLQTPQISYRDEHCLAVLYDLSLQGPGRVQYLRCNELQVLRDQNRSQEKSGQILLLRGYAPAEWINTIGAKYGIDPEFFHRHLDFFVTLIPRRVFAIPSLPSTSVNIHKLRITTILFREKLKNNRRKENLETRRVAEFERMEAYHRQFQGRGQSGDSIVRDFATLDEEFLLVEQEISLCVVRNGEGWLALVWLDIGRDLARGPYGPWSALESSRGPRHESFPIIQHHPKMVPRQTIMEKDVLANDDHPFVYYQSHTKIPQSTASLPFELETFLDEKSSRDNPFYALSNIFRHAAFSEVQVLNLVESQIDQEIGVMKPEAQRSHTLNNLQFFKTILTRHTRCIRYTLCALKSADDNFFLGGDPAITFAMTRSLTADFDKLLAQALELLARCTEEMGVMMNRAIIVESRKAIEQSERLKKLTMLAAFFVPLSFTTSLFGMNFKEFGQGGLSVWIFVVVSVPMLAISFSFYMWDVWAIFKSTLLWVWLNAIGRGQWLHWRTPSMTPNLHP